MLYGYSTGKKQYLKSTFPDQIHPESVVANWYWGRSSGIIYYLSLTLAIYPGEHTGRTINMVDVKTGKVIISASVPTYGESAEWSPDGKNFIVAINENVGIDSENSQVEPYLFSNSGEFTKLTSLARLLGKNIYSLDLKWSPDGRSISIIMFQHVSKTDKTGTDHLAIFALI